MGVYLLIVKFNCHTANFGQEPLLMLHTFMCCSGLTVFINFLCFPICELITPLIDIGINTGQYWAQPTRVTIYYSGPWRGVAWHWLSRLRGSAAAPSPAPAHRRSRNSAESCENLANPGREVAYTGRASSTETQSWNERVAGYVTRQRNIKTFPASENILCSSKINTPSSK